MQGQLYSVNCFAAHFMLHATVGGLGVYLWTLVNSKSQPSHLCGGIAQMVAGQTLRLYKHNRYRKVVGLMPDQPNQLLYPCECLFGMSMSYLYS